MKGLTNKYLENLSFKCLKQFLGVFPCDFLNDIKLKVNDTLIVNLSESSKKGSHFVALSIKNDNVIYFDSFGLKCENPYILDVCKLNNKDIVYTDLQTQDIKSYFCGYFCLSFLICDQNGTSLEDFHRKLDSKDLQKNDF